MAVTKVVPDHQAAPSLRGRVIRYYDKGEWRARSWPKKSGPPTNLKVKRQVEWFRQMVKLMKHDDYPQQLAAIEEAKGTGWYPHDILMNAYAGNRYRIIEEDGREWTKYKPEVRPAVYAGCRLRRTSNFVTTANVWFEIPWQQVSIDTSGYFNPTFPTRMTIPTGVNVVEAFLTFGGNDTQSAYRQAKIEVSGSGPIAVFDVINATTHRFTMSSGPIPVAAGLYLTAWIFCTRALTGGANSFTHFALNVLDAD